MSHTPTPDTRQNEPQGEWHRPSSPSTPCSLCGKPLNTPDCSIEVPDPVTSPSELRVLTVDQLVRSMIREQANAIALYIDGVQYHLSLDYVG